MIGEICTKVQYTQTMEREPVLRVDRIKELMGERGWGIGELSVYSFVKYDTAYKVVTDQRQRVSAEILMKIATALRVSPEYLMDLTDLRLVPMTTLDEALTRLVETAKTLPDGRKNDLTSIAAAFHNAKSEEEENIAQIMETVLEKVEELGGRRQVELLLDELRSLLPSRLR